MPTVTILPDSTETTLCVQMEGRITAADFERFFHQEIKRRADRHGYFNLVVNYGETFDGWEADAAERNLKSIVEMGTKPKRLAYVNPPKKKILLMKVTEPLVTGEIRYFEKDAYAEAVAWAGAG